MIPIPHYWSERAANWLFRKLVPARGLELDDEQFDRIDARARGYERWELWGGMCIGMATIALSTLLLAQLDPWILPPVDQPVLNTRGWFRWFVPGAGVGLLISQPLVRAYRRHAWGDDLEAYRIHWETKKGYDPVRAERWLVVALVAFTAIFAAFCWNRGEIVDRNGIVFLVYPFTTVQRSFGEVKSVELFQALRAPIGVVDSPNLRVTFADGPELRIAASRGDGPKGVKALARAAQYISEKSGVDIVHGTIRP